MKSPRAASPIQGEDTIMPHSEGWDETSQFFANNELWEWRSLTSTAYAVALLLHLRGETVHVIAQCNKAMLETDAAQYKHG